MSTSSVTMSIWHLDLIKNPRNPPSQFGMAGDDRDPIVVSTATACVHQSDLETLGKDEWVGDNILAFHAEWLDDLGTRLNEASSAPSVKMMPPSVVELLCALDEEAGNQASSVVPTPSERFLLLPVSDRYSSSSPGHSAGGSHWSLLFIDAHKGDSFHLDSLGDINRTAANTVQDSIRTLIQAKSGGTLRPAKPRNVECLQQQANGSDCGIYVLFLSSLLHRRLSDDSQPDKLDALIQDVCESSTPDTVMKFRHKYLSWLQTWGEVTHHEEHVQPDQRIRARFLQLFSGLGVE